MSIKRIVLVTSSQPSLNPRMVKEADTLSEAGYEVIVVGQYWNEWATQTDQELLLLKKWKFIRVGGSPAQQTVTFFVSRLVHKIARKLRVTLGFKFGIAELSIGRCTWLLYQQAAALKADLYIGHNPGGLSPAILAAKKNKAKCGFDAEDFHRLEYSDDPGHPDVRCKKFLEEKYFPQADYITCASPLISEEYKRLFPHLDFNTILNVFPRVTDVSVSDSKSPLKLFWFSQTIGHNRGLDEVIEALRILGTPLIEIHALGNPREHVIHHYKELAKEYGLLSNQLNFYDPIAPEKIFSFASKFDVGLATEIGVPFNRQICLTNKIFTYIQSGLAIAASRTPAQELLMTNFPYCGRLFEVQDSHSLANVIGFFLQNRAILNEAKQKSYFYGQHVLNWEVESQKFLARVNNSIGKH